MRRRPVVAIHQPNYLPWLGWFAKALVADVFVLLDDVQFEKGGYTNRVRVGAPSGPVLLTVPVRRPRGLATTVREVELGADPRWRARHLRTLERAYGRAPGWESLGAELTAAILAPEERLASLNERLIRLLLPRLGCGARLVRSSELAPREGAAGAALAAICRELGAATYLCGEGGRKYMDAAPFASAGVEVSFTPFRHPTYAQPWSAFVPGLSAIDLLMRDPSHAAATLRASVAA